MIAFIDKVSKSFAAQVLYSQASFALNAKERWALVGPNGTGKTTLLNIICGRESADSGRVSFGKDVRIGYLEQQIRSASSKSILMELIDSASEIKTLEKQVTKLEKDISSCEDQTLLESMLERYGRLRERLEHLGAYSIETQARQVLAGLGFAVSDFERSAQKLSGGWSMRLALAKLLLSRPDLLLLDEPTNHLDLESVLWLEQFIAGYDGAVLLVSHDRSFMDACVTHVAALENKRLNTYSGNYSSYLSQREANLEQLRAKRAAQERDIAHMETFVERFRYKPTKAKQVQERVKRIEKIKSELVVLPERSKRVHFSFPKPPRTGDMVVSFENVSKYFGNTKVYDNCNFKLYRGDHVALVGPNGAGKSTTMKLIAGLEGVTEGTIELGHDVTLAYYAQHQLEQLDPANTVLAELDSCAPSWTSSEERRLLGAFLFHGDDVEKRVSVLSGGEQSRLALAKMLVSPDPLLLLDEPTNHLDIESVDILESALKNFDGTIVLISHDEHLVKTLANKVIDIRDHTITLYDGDYDYYREKRAQIEQREETELAQSATNSANSAQEHNRGRNTKTKEQRRQEAEARNAANAKLKGVKTRLREVEAALGPNQVRYNELMEMMADEKTYADTSKFQDALSEYNALTKKISALEAEWLELSERLEEADVSI